jgi:hypothetical protein
MEKFAFLITCDDRVTRVTPREGDFFYLDELWNYCDGYVVSTVIIPGVRAVYTDKPFVYSMHNKLGSLLLRSEIRNPILVYMGYETFFDKQEENKDGKQ